MVASTLLYICVFFISTVLFWLSQKLKSNLLAVLGLLVPCLFAALRSPEVGIDVNLYVMPNFDESRGLIANGFLYFYKNMPFSTEIGFAFLLYIGNLFDSLPLSFFFIHALIVIPIYLALRLYKDRVSLPLGMIVFYLLLYNFSLSCMRGSIAMSLLLYAFVLFVHLKYFRACLVLLFASLFHNSTFLVAFIIFFVTCILKNRRREMLIVAFFLCAIFVFLFFSKIMNVVAQIVMIANPRYAYYLYTYVGTGSFADVPITDFLCKLLLIVFAFIFINNKKKIRFSYFNLYGAFFLFALVGRFFVLFNAVFYEAMRIAFYFDMFLILLVAFVPKCYKEDSDLARFCLSAICSLPAFFYWAYFIMWKGAYGTSVYSFNF